jgi:hypothetical protein
VAELSDFRKQLKSVPPSVGLLIDLAAIVPPSLFGSLEQLAEWIDDPVLRIRILRLLTSRATHRRRAKRTEPVDTLPTPEYRPAALEPALYSRLGAASDKTLEAVLRPLLHDLDLFLRPRGSAAEEEESAAAPTEEATFGGRDEEGVGAAPPEEGELRLPVSPVAGGPAVDFDISEPPVAPPRLARRPRRPAIAERHRRRVVSTGFATVQQQREPLPASEPLRGATEYWYWLEIGPPVRGAIDTSKTELLPDQELESGERLTVVLFGFPEEIHIDRERRIGEFEYLADASFGVARQPGSQGAPAAAASSIQPNRRMFFPIRTPANAGRYRLRCSIYFRNVLVQSRLVSAYVGRTPVRASALSARVDFQVATLLGAADLAPIKPHLLSVHLNTNRDHSHSFRFVSFARDLPPIASDATLSASNLQDLIEQARQQMRTAAWGSPQAWSVGTPFRYDAPPYPDATDDLFELMRRGRHLYDAIINELAEGPDAAVELRARMMSPGRVQIVNSGPASELIPTSLIYDYPNADPAIGRLTLCPAFLAARASDASLESAPCFEGRCPSVTTPQVVCPSGFWGFRHAIGIPVTSKWGPPAPLRSTYVGSPTLGMAVFPGFKLLAAHQQRLAKERPGWTMLDVADTYEEARAMLMAKARPNVAYFYCHGGVSAGNIPYLEVGGPGQLAPVSFRDQIFDRYRAPRSLIILNGCETVALEPDRAMSLVSAFVDNVGAGGVIGTEITVNENLAWRFAETLLRHIRAGEEIGRAVRLARLALLKEGNPLGLVYLPLVSADARLVEA